MSTGLEWDEYPGDMYKTTDRTGYVLSRQVVYPAGEEFHYNSGNSIVLGEIILSLIKEDVESFCQKILFNPVGITDYTWKTPTNGVVEVWNGLLMTPRDMAKIGLLVQNKGEWNQKQIVSKNWILESTKPYIAESEFFDYGYQWWIRSENCKRWWDNQSAGLHDDVEMIIALSWGGQYIIIINEYNLVIVTTASNYSNDKAMAIFPMIIERVIPAIKGN
jgi:CubicO group peptidase (beta-lactamase class C family)